MTMILTGSGTGTVGVPNSGTAQNSTSGTNIDFTGIPAGTKRITVMFNGVSTNGVSDFGIQLGASGGIQATGYLGGVGNTGTGYSATTTYARLVVSGAAATTSFGTVTIALINASTNTWGLSGVLGATGYAYSEVSGFSVSLSGALTTVRIMTGNGTDTFDAGSINILYE